MNIPPGSFDTDTTQTVIIPKKRKKYRKRKTNQYQKKNHGKQAMNSTDGTGGTKRPHEGNQHEDQSKPSGNVSNCANNNSSNQRKEDIDKKSTQFNDQRCPGKFGGDGDTTDVEQLETFSINLKFQNVPKDKVAKVLKAFSFKYMNKVDGITFHPTNNQTLPNVTKRPFQLVPKRHFRHRVPDF